MKKVTLILVCLFLVSCKDITLENPQPKDVTGQWELFDNDNLFFSYALLDFDLHGEAKIVSVGFDELATLVGVLKNFQSQSNFFYTDIDLSIEFFSFDVDDPELVIETARVIDLINHGLKVVGKVGGNRVCLSFQIKKGSKLEKELMKDENLGDNDFLDQRFCFIKSSVVEQNRQLSYALLKKLNKETK